MTLSKQVMIIIVSVFLLVFAGTFLITVHNTKQFYVQQLSSNAQDTATSLGLTLSTHVQKQDKATILSMINAIFDRGYFSSIVVETLDGKALVSRKLSLRVPDVPTWFIHLVSLPKIANTAVIMSGWHQVGQVIVESNPSYAYLELWKSTKELFLLYIIIATFVIIMCLLMLKLIFKPLVLVTEQAQAICAKKFHIQEKLPRTWELRQVTDAMNRMVLKLKKLFEKQAQETQELRNKVYQDPLTGLGNHRYLVQQLEQFLTTEDDYISGFFIMLEVANLAPFNQQYGYKKGDEVILAVSRQLQESFEDQVVPFKARLNGPGFALIIAELNISDLEEVLGGVLENLKSIMLSIDASLSLNIGVVKYDYGMEVSQLLAQGDIAFRYAVSSGKFSYHIEKAEIAKSLSTQQWKARIQESIQNDSFCYYGQDIICEGNVIHKELFARMLDVKSREEVPAGQFIPIAEKYQLGFEIDRLLVNRLLTEELEGPVAINLSASTIGSEENQQFYLNLLTSFTEKQRGLISFEINESVAFANRKLMANFISQLVSLNFAVGLDRVGSNFSSFYYLSGLQISYLKLDGSLTKNSDDSANQLFLKNLVKSAETLDILVIATNIETGEQMETLSRLGIFCGQGLYLSKLKRVF